MIGTLFISEWGIILKIEGQVVIITGGSSGLGEVAAHHLAQAGAKVIIASRGEEKALQVVKEIEANNGKAVYIRTDIADEAQVQKCLQVTIGQFGKIDAVFNNAGSAPRGDWMEKSESWSHTLSTAANGTFFMCKNVIPYMQESGGGSIINMSSIAAVTGHLPKGTPEFTQGLSYNATKGAVESYTLALAVAVGPLNIRVNAIRPGWFPTALTMKDPERAAIRSKFFLERQALKFHGDPKDIAEAVLFLTSPASRFITGHILTVDGGLTLR